MGGCPPSETGNTAVNKVQGNTSGSRHSYGNRHQIKHTPIGWKLVYLVEVSEVNQKNTRLRCLVLVNAQQCVRIPWRKEKVMVSGGGAPKSERIEKNALPPG